MPLRYIGNYEQRLNEWLNISKIIEDIEFGKKNVYLSSSKKDKNPFVKLKEWLKTKYMKRKFYALPSPPDWRDYTPDKIGIYAYKNGQLPRKKINSLPPWILDQEDTPFCVGASGAGSGNAWYHRFEQLPFDGFSMSFLYWLSKNYDGIPEQEGTYIRTGNKIMEKYGLCREALAPLKEMKSKPIITNEMIDDAKNYKIEGYAKLETLEEIKSAITDGYYVIIGTLITSRNWDTNDGFLGLPSGYVLGGHATYLYGYNDDLEHGDHKGYLYGVNSWGDDFGDEGKFYMPYDLYYWESADLPGFFVFLEAWAIKFQELDPPQPPPEPDPPPEPTPPDFPHVIYIVKKGDTMYSIAQKHDVTLQQLIDANPHIKDPSKIYPGNILYVPVSERPNIFMIIWNFLVSVFNKIFRRR